MWLNVYLMGVFMKMNFNQKVSQIKLEMLKQSDRTRGVHHSFHHHTESESTASAENEQDRKICPLHQNWWPVSMVEALHSARPNAVQLLGMDLVLYQSDMNIDDWTCLED
jgi:hypothetical protein